MKYKLLALLTDRPDDIDWAVLGDIHNLHPAAKWVYDYYTTYASLPTLELFAQECLDEGEPPIATAPWAYYVKEYNDVKFVQEATKYIGKFNEAYANDPKSAILALREEFMRLTEPQKTVAAADIAAQTKERWEKFSLRQGARIKTGIIPFDEASGGISPDDEFMILSARLGQGKSFFLHFIALEMAKEGHNVGIYSGEMTEYEVGARIDTWLTHVNNFDLTRGKISDSSEQVKAYEEKVKGKILVITPHHIGHNATPSDMRKFVKENNLSVLCIDQLSLMIPDGRQSSEMFQQFASISMQLKSLQQELRIPIIAVSQLNRAAAEQEVNAANISGSDRIGQDATIILAIERKENEMVLKVLKARSFKKPERGWTFTWDINNGVLTPQLTAIDAVVASNEALRAQEEMNRKLAEAAAAKAANSPDIQITDQQPVSDLG
ncbi:MAG: DnaB helicase C-terminal domain-containing protein [Acetobacter sp.]|nr:DnaB helicase C-terminal domain-containing protein [Acetobacter sp.]